MSNAQDSRSESSNPARYARAAAAFMVVVVMGYAISTQVESAVTRSTQATPLAQAGQQEIAPTVYFPSQFVNQGKEVEEFIPTF